MKPSSPAAGRRTTIDRTKARNCTLLNLLATPGLGSLMAGRIVAGIGQLLLAVTGSVLIVVWFFKIFFRYAGEMSGSVDVKPVGPIGIVGAALFVTAWLWSLATSLSVAREARRNEAGQTKEQS